MGFGTFTTMKLFGIIVLQFMGHPPGRYRILFYHDCTPPTTSLKLLLCLWTWGIFFFGGFQHPPVHGCSTASCNFGAFTRGYDCTSFYSAILNWKSRLRVLNYNIRLSFTHTQKKHNRKFPVAKTIVWDQVFKNFCRLI